MATETETASQVAGSAQGVVEAVGKAAEKSENYEGMPQLNFDWFANQIFWLVITLVVIYLILTRVALPRIAAVLAERQGTITNDLSAAEELKLRAVEAEAAYEKALLDARAEANRIVAETRAEIKVDLDAAIARADAEIAAKSAESEKAINVIKASAKDAVAEVAKDTAAAIVASLGIKADAKSIGAAVTARLKGAEQ